MSRHLPIYDLILDAAEDALTVKPDRKIVQPGQEVAQDEAPNGQLSVRLISATPITRQRGKCPVGVELEIGVRHARCVGVIDDRGNPPSEMMTTLDGLQTLQDMTEIASALSCLADDLESAGVYEAWLGRWDPEGPLGGYAGGEWKYYARMKLPWSV